MLMPPLLSMLVTPLVESVAVPSGTLPPVQLAGSVHSLGSPTLPPTHVASTARADTIPSAVLANRIAIVGFNARELRLGAPTAVGLAGRIIVSSRKIRNHR